MSPSVSGLEGSDGADLHVGAELCELPREAELQPVCLGSVDGRFATNRKSEFPAGALKNRSDLDSRAELRFCLITVKR